MDEPTRHQRINHSIEIAAPAEVIWHHINYPTNIQPDELKNGWAYRIGVPYPVSARTLDERVGGKRELQWQHGVKFQEVITKWQPTQHIAWRYEFEADSFPPDSLDDHIVIGGRYFQLNDTSYTLAPLPNGNTRLSISVGTSIRTSFNWYAEPWAKFLLSDTAQTILNFYKVRAELGK